MGETKKVGLTGRFGSRYGVGIRKRLLKTEKEQRKKQFCPNCEKTNVKRKAKGIFKCNSCEFKFAGGAYIPETLAGKLVKKMISQKKFSAQEFQELEQLEETLSKQKEEQEKKLKKKQKNKTTKTKPKETKKDSIKSKDEKDSKKVKDEKDSKKVKDEKDSKKNLIKSKKEEKK